MLIVASFERAPYAVKLCSYIIDCDVTFADRNQGRLLKSCVNNFAHEISLDPLGLNMSPRPEWPSFD